MKYFGHFEQNGTELTTLVMTNIKLLQLNFVVIIVEKTVINKLPIFLFVV